jgi:branched-chain amino acid transport system permease protein
MSKVRANLGDAVTVLVTLVALIAVSATSDYLVYLVTLFLVYSIGAIGYNVVLGNAGQFAFGHAGFLALGAYVFTVCRQEEIALGLSIVLAMLSAGAVGLVIGAVALRTSEIYLALVTLAFAQAIVLAIGLWPAAGGFNGLLVAAPSAQSLLFMTGGIALVLYVVTQWMLRGRLGHAFTMLRDDQQAAQAVGVNIVHTRLVAFTFSACFAGVAGALYAMAVGYITPESFGIGETLKYLTMIVIGGLASPVGAVIGAAVVVALPEFLSLSSQGQDVLFGIVLFVFIVFVPGGVSASVQRLVSRTRVAAIHKAVAARMGGDKRAQ